VKVQVKLFTTKEPPVLEVRADHKALALRDRVVAHLVPIDTFDFGLHGNALLIECSAPVSALSIHRSSGGEWKDLPLDDQVMGNKEDGKKKKKGKKDKQYKKEEEDGSKEQKVKMKLRIEGDEAKRAKVKEAFLVALAKAKEAVVKGDEQLPVNFLLLTVVVTNPVVVVGEQRSNSPAEALMMKMKTTKVTKTTAKEKEVWTKLRKLILSFLRTEL